MNKILLILSIVISQTYFAQIQRFIYEITAKPSLENKNETKTETAYLDIAPGISSIFISENRVKRDSTFQRMRETRTFNPSQIQNFRTIMNAVITKDLVMQKQTHRERIGRDTYAYEEDRPMNWKVLPETSKIGDYEVQRAETEFAGRVWHAWFATDIPLQDGPYKFCGLPGLIIKVEDADGDYSFDLKEAKKVETAASVSERGTVMKVKRKDFEKQMALYRKDPASVMNSASQGRFGGNRQPDPQRMRDMENRIKEELKATSNHIER